MSTSPNSDDFIPADLIARADQDNARIRHEHGLLSLLKSPAILNAQRIQSGVGFMFPGSTSDTRVQVTLSTTVSADAWPELNAVLNQPLVPKEEPF